MDSKPSMETSQGANAHFPCWSFSEGKQTKKQTQNKNNRKSKTKTTATKNKKKTKTIKKKIEKKRGREEKASG